MHESISFSSILVANLQHVRHGGGKMDIRNIPLQDPAKLCKLFRYSGNKGKSVQLSYMHTNKSPDILYPFSGSLHILNPISRGSKMTRISHHFFL